MVKYKTKVDAAGEIVAFWDSIGPGPEDGFLDDDGFTVRDISIDPGPFDRTTYYWSNGWQRRESRPSRLYDWVDGAWVINNERACARQKEALNKRFQEFATNPLLTVNGITWQATAVEIVAMEAVAGSFNSVTLNASGNIEWKDVNNIYHEYTEAEFAALVASIKTAYVVRRDAGFNKLQELKNALPLDEGSQWLTTDWSELL